MVERDSLSGISYKRNGVVHRGLTFTGSKYLFSGKEVVYMRTGFFYWLLLAAVVVPVWGSEPEVQWSAGFSRYIGSVVWDVAEVLSGGYITVGDVPGGVSGEKALNISRIDSDGIVLWENTALSLGNSSAQSIENFSDGFVACGMCSDSSNNNGLILNFDTEGVIAWHINPGYEGDDALFDLCLTSDGSIIAVGLSYNSETSDNDVFAVCVSDTGLILWQRRFVAPGYQAAYSIIPSINSQEEFVLTGADNGEVFLMKIDSQGNWLWKASHFAEGNQTGRGLTVSSEGGYIVAGTTSGSVGFSDIFLVLFDTEGKVLNDYSWGTDGPDNAYSILDVPPAGFVVLVNSNSGTGEGYRPSLVRFDPWLSVIWSLELTDTDAICYSLKIAENGGFVVAGKSSLPGNGSEYSSFLMKLTAEDLLNWE